MLRWFFLFLQVVWFWILAYLVIFDSVLNIRHKIVETLINIFFLPLAKVSMYQSGLPYWSPSVAYSIVYDSQCSTAVWKIRCVLHCQWPYMSTRLTLIIILFKFSMDIYFPLIWYPANWKKWNTILLLLLFFISHNFWYNIFALIWYSVMTSITVLCLSSVVSFGIMKFPFSQV